jgi:hypothetical protein
MKVKEGDEVRSELDGEDYIITRIVGKRLVLKRKNGEKEIITWMESLRTLYKKREESKA